jgi:HAE1 family hydrophobic/amphiphilic exporter-1
VVRAFERGFDSVLGAYTRSLDMALRWRKTVLGVALGTFVATAWVFYVIPKGFFPEEDIGQVQVTTEAAEDVSIEAMLALQQQVIEVFLKHPSVATVNSVVGGNATPNNARLFVNLKPRAERESAKAVIEDLRKRTRAIPGIAVFMRPVQNLNVGSRPSKARYQYVLQSVEPSELDAWANRLQEQLPSTSTVNRPMRWVCRWMSSARPSTPHWANARSPPSSHQWTPIGSSWSSLQKPRWTNGRLQESRCAPPTAPWCP